MTDSTTTKPDNPYAFSNTGNNTWGMEPEYGMTLRDWFAGQAIPALIIQVHANGGCADGIEGPVSSVAYIVADAMLARREKSDD